MVSCSVKRVAAVVIQRKLYYHKPHGEFCLCTAFVYDLESREGCWSSSSSSLLPPNARGELWSDRLSTRGAVARITLEAKRNPRNIFKNIFVYWFLSNVS